MLWIQEIGQGYSGFIAVGDKVYTQTQTLYEQDVICLEAETAAKCGPIAMVGRIDGGYSIRARAIDSGLVSEPRLLCGARWDCWLSECSERNAGLVEESQEQYRGQGTDFGCACSPLLWTGSRLSPWVCAASVIALNCAERRIGLGVG